MKGLPFRRGLVLALALAVLAVAALAVWLGVFRQERAAASPGPVDLTVGLDSTPDSGTTMAPGGIISYTVTVTSDDQTDATGDNIALTINLSNATLVDGSLSSPDEVTCTGSDPIDCQVPDFDAAGSKSVSFDAVVGTTGPVLAGATIDPPIDGSAPGEVTEEGNDAGTDDGTHADGDDGDDDGLECAPVGEGDDADPVEEPDNFDCTSHGVATADLTITKESSPAEGTAVPLGSAIIYTLTARNASGASGTATNVVIRDYVGSGLTFASATPGTGVTCGDRTPPEINCTVASLAAGGSATVAIVVSVAATSGLLLNGAYVDPDDAIEETNEDADDPDLVCASVGEGSDTGDTEPDNYDCAAHAAGAVDLTIVKTASPSEDTTVATGSTITYTLTVSNSAAATGPATGVPIRDYIGSGLNVSSVTPGTGVTCGDTTPPEINCTAGSIGPNESRTVTIVVTVEATSGEVLNGARVDPGNAISEINEDADDATLDCGAVGEGTDAGDPTEADNFDCTRHWLAAMPTPGELLSCPLSGLWAISVWDGPSGTATGDALATCTDVTIDAAYSLDRSTNDWSRYFPERADVSNLLTLDEMQAIITLGR